MMSDFENNDQGEIFSKAVRAGKRTYFFDVKATRGNEYYLTITESKKYFEDDKPFYKKHKLFLYKEDFEKFVEGLEEAVSYIQDNQPESDRPAPTEKKEEDDDSGSSSSFTDIKFEDLGSGDSDVNS
jgi:hypothetical protein